MWSGRPNVWMDSQVFSQRRKKISCAKKSLQSDNPASLSNNQITNEPASPEMDISNHQFINDIDFMVTMTMTALTSAMQMRKGHKRPRVVLLLYMWWLFWQEGKKIRKPTKQLAFDCMPFQHPVLFACRWHSADVLLPHMSQQRSSCNCQ